MAVKDINPGLNTGGLGYQHARIDSSRDNIAQIINPLQTVDLIQYSNFHIWRIPKTIFGVTNGREGDALINVFVGDPPAVPARFVLKDVLLSDLMNEFDFRIVAPMLYVYYNIPFSSAMDAILFRVKNNHPATAFNFYITVYSEVIALASYINAFVR